ncbi:hypothetical protein QUB68_04960 [Microcoleus sp. A006_D1]|uniref:hypothetical protein n=1 Tax=Microcoleus sp. A006_D1 TaxID=3055267 RepID=UPI002FCF5E46
MSDRLRVCSTGLQLDAPFESVVTYRIRYRSVITGLPVFGENTENINSVRSRMPAPQK